MNLEIHSCAGGVVEVPDLRGSKKCYSSDYDKLVITQTPPPGELVSAGQTIINVLAEDQSGNATLCTHYLNVTADNPAPTLICPEPIVAWLVTGGYEVPDLTQSLEIIGGCTVIDDLVITQSPAAGTKLTTAGEHTITITVEDEFGHEVVCGTTTVTLKNPSPVPVVPAAPPALPVTVPTYIYPANLLAYWPLDSATNLPLGQTTYLDASFLVTGAGPLTRRDLTAGGSESISADQTVLGSCHPVSSGPIFGRGSMFSSGAANGYASRVDDAALRLLATDFTIRAGIKIKSIVSGSVWMAVNKGTYFGAGYRIMVTLPIAGDPYISAQVGNGSATVNAIPFGSVPQDVWHHVVMTWSNTSKTLRMYINATEQLPGTNPSFSLAGTVDPFLIGAAGTNAEVYHDEVGIWTEAWSQSRINDDFEIVRCL